METELTKEEKQRQYRRNWYLKNKERTAEARREATRRWREANPDKYRESYTDQNEKQKDRRRAYNQQEDVKARRRKLQREWREKNPEKNSMLNREAHFRKKYGITLAQWDEMFLAQGSCCAACREADETVAVRWVVDHCHTTQKVRGILCYRCNVALGLVKDQKNTLLRLADYLGG